MSESLGKKRDWAVSEIEEEARGVCVHGFPQLVSPVKGKKGLRYFDNDGKKVRRIISGTITFHHNEFALSFDAALQPSMKKAEEEEPWRTVT